MSSANQKVRTKLCSQCEKEFTKDQFAAKQWKKANPSCRLCGEYTKHSPAKDRTCDKCRVTKPRIEFDVYQWSKGEKAMCHPCRDKFADKCLSKLDDTTSQTKQLPDQTMVCSHHSKELCDICMMDFTLPNQFQRKRNALGRELSQKETDEATKEWQSSNGIYVSKKICIMDGKAVCPRNSRKLRCPCEEVTYCSKQCQQVHWSIHKMTCKFQAEKKKKKAEKVENKEEVDRKALADSLTEEQKNAARMEAFFLENNGRKGAIEECAWQLCEHPLVIGGGSITLSMNGEEFKKGDVAKIYGDAKGVDWDGSPRFGLPPYAPSSNPMDWIAVARRGRSQRFKDIENEVRRRIDS